MRQESSKLVHITGADIGSFNPFVPPLSFIPSLSVSAVSPYVRATRYLHSERRRYSLICAKRRNEQFLVCAAALAGSPAR